MEKKFPTKIDSLKIPSYAVTPSFSDFLFVFFCFFRCVAPGCNKAITANDYLIVKTTGVVSFVQNGVPRKREGTVYLHFLEGCLKSYFENFDYRNIQVFDDTKTLLKKKELEFLKALNIQV